MAAEMPLSGFCVFPAFVLVIVVFAFVFGVRRVKKQNLLLKDLALQMGLRFKPAGKWGHGTLEGEYRGRRVKLYAYTQGSGKHSTTYTVLNASHDAPLAGEISLSREGFGTRIAKAVGFKEVRVGNPKFDGEFFIRVKNPCDVKYLNMEVQHILPGYKQIPAIKPGVVEIKFVGYQDDKNLIRQAFDGLVELADKLEEGA